MAEVPLQSVTAVCNIWIPIKMLQVVLFSKHTRNALSKSGSKKKFAKFDSPVLYKKQTIKHISV